MRHFVANAARRFPDARVVVGSGILKANRDLLLIDFRLGIVYANNAFMAETTCRRQGTSGFELLSDEEMGGTWNSTATLTRAYGLLENCARLLAPGAEFQHIFHGWDIARRRRP